MVLRTGTKALDSKVPFKSVLSNKRGSVAEDDAVDGRAEALRRTTQPEAVKFIFPASF